MIKKKSNFNGEKASLIYGVEIKKIRERQHNERTALFDDLQSRNMRKQGPGYHKIFELVAKQIEEDIEIYVDALLSTIDESRIVDEDDEKALIQDMVNHLEAIVNLENSAVRRKLHADGWASEKAFNDAALAALPNKSLSTRQYLTDKIRLKVKNLNDELKKKRKGPIKKLFSSEFYKTGTSMFYKWLWGIVGLVVLSLLGLWWRSCVQQEKKKKENTLNQVFVPYQKTLIKTF